jgi:hypothetical protein
MKIRNLLVLACVLFTTFSVSGQTEKRNFLTYDFGGAITSGGGITASGLDLSLGYTTYINNSRIFFNPNIIVGAFAADGGFDLRPNYYNTLSVRAQFGYDLLQYKGFSLDLQAGLVVGTARGMIGTGGEFNSTASERIKEWNYGAVAASALKFSIPESRFSIRVVPMSVHIGPNYYLELHSLVGIAVSL